MGYGMSGLLLTQVHDLRLKGGILNGRADNTISGRIQFGDFFK